MQKHSLLTLVAATGVLVITTPVAAQDTYEPMKAELARVMRSVCEKMAPRFIEVREVKPMTDLRPITADAICSCAQERFQQDQQIDQVLRRPQQEVGALAKTEKFKSYVAMRYMAATLECTAKEFSATLQAADFAK
jgi:hypothetical protein